MGFELSDVPEIKVEEWDKLVINDIIFYSNNDEKQFLSIKVKDNYYEIELFDCIQEEVIQKELCYYPHVAEECIHNIIHN